jgi:putative endonuclease
MPDNDWYVYILQCADNTLYTGVATDVSARLATHNAGKGAKYTRGRLPVALLYQESAESRSAALKREHAIKKMRAGDKRYLIATQVQNIPALSARRRAQKTTVAISSGKASPNK